MFDFTPVNVTHIPLLFSWFQQPHVIQWWQEPQDLTRFTDKWQIKITGHAASKQDPAAGFCVSIDQTPIGYVQYHRVNENDRRGYPPLPDHTVGMDIFIGNPSYLGKGFAAPIITEFIEKVITIKEPKTTCIIIDPEPNNTRAVHVYKKAGFTPIGEYNRSSSRVLLMSLDIKQKD
jgi:aminoglycoside 6'-N-acetyltransferase